MKRSLSVELLGQSVLSLPTTLVSRSLPSDSWKVTLCHLTPCARNRSASPFAAADSSLLASDRTRLTFGDQCNAVSTAGYTGSVSTLTCIFEVMNGSVSLMGGFPNCSATVCAVTDIPSGMSHDWDGIAFGESRCANCSDCGHARRRHLFHLVLWIH